MMLAMRLRVLILVLVAVAVAAVPAFASGGSNRIVGNCTKSTVAPKSIVLACADDNAYIAHVTWTSFGGASASGAGSLTVNTCSPNCAAGKFVSYPVTFKASAAKPCPDHYDDYRALAVVFAGAPPKYYTKRYSTKLFCPIP